MAAQPKANLNEMMVSYEVNGKEVKLSPNIVKNYLTRGNEDVTEQEVVMFINLCKYQELNPFLNEAYLVKFKGSPAQLITSKEAYMKRAEDYPSFDGFRAGIIIQRGNEIIDIEGCFSLSNDILLGGWAEVYVKDKKYPVKIRINLDEFTKGQSTWKSMPKTMIRKTALVQALREAFPKKMGSLYTEEEADLITDNNTVQGASREVQREEDITQKLIIDVTPNAEPVQQKIDEDDDMFEGTPFK